MKGRILEKTAAVVCALCLAVGVMSGVVFARDEEPAGELPADPEATFVVVDQSEATAEILMPEITPGTSTEQLPAGIAIVGATDNRSEIPFYVGDEQRGTCSVVSGVPYADVYDFCTALGLAVTAGYGDGQYVVAGDGVVIAASEGDLYFTCNDRSVLAEAGVRAQAGHALLPVEALAKCLGVTVAWDRVRWTITAQAGGISPLTDGDTYYDETDLYWLSRVIYAEAGNQPLKGKIAVGNVVLNRVKDDSFKDQNSVYDVIFAKNQFEVVINGMIYMEPSEEAVMAAKLAMEGYDVSGGSTYFATFDFGEGYQCVEWIGDHCFMTQA